MIRYLGPVALLAVFLASPAIAADFQEMALAIPMTDGSGNKLVLAGRLCLPRGVAKPRVVLHNHGRTQPASQAVMLGCDSQLAQWYLGRNFAVSFMLRRGYGANGVGRVIEDPAGCGGRLAYAQAALEGARDIAAAVDFLGVLPQVRNDGMVVQGHSAGGFATIAFAAFNEKKVAALVNFAGGRLCGDVRVVWAAVAALGEASKASPAPMLWM
jgi:cephalosporin-C deacetylase-like acetyl esterase